jgi:hypothetical protein
MLEQLMATDMVWIKISTHMSSKLASIAAVKSSSPESERAIHSSLLGPEV